MVIHETRLSRAKNKRKDEKGIRVLHERMQQHVEIVFEHRERDHRGL